MFNILNKCFSFLLIPILTLNKSRMTAWRGKPIFISITTVDNSDTSPITVMVTSIDRKSPIREFLPMQKNILSMIFCRSPISLIEPSEHKEFLERRLDPLLPGLWIKIISHRFIISFYPSPEVSSPYYLTPNVSEDFPNMLILNLKKYGKFDYLFKTLPQSLLRSPSTLSPL